MRRRKSKNKSFLPYLNILLISFALFLIYTSKDDVINFFNTAFPNTNSSATVLDIPPYQNKPYIILNNNQTNFQNEYNTEQTFENYSELDSLGRCGVAVALVGLETMPDKERESIGMIKPTGWHTVKYDFIDGKYLYNRCHLIGYQLTGENANDKNLITCTRSMNAKTMLEFENKVANYVKKTKHHVLYRVTPIFEGLNLLATGVEMEAKSIEDNALEFHVFVYNVEDGVSINYQNGDSTANS